MKAKGKITTASSVKPKKSSFVTKSIDTTKTEGIKQIPKYQLDSGLFDIIPFGYDNLFPVYLNKINQTAPIHRSILNKKTTYICGRGFISDSPELDNWMRDSNAKGQDFQETFKKLITDDQHLGNSYIQITTDDKLSFLNIDHTDATYCRISKKRNSILIADWENESMVTKDNVKEIPLFPAYKSEGGLLRSIIHVKDYEPSFMDYGIPEWFSGIKSAYIAYKTDKWNLTRINKDFKPSGMMVVEGSYESDEEAESAIKDFEDTFTGEDNQGQIVFMIKEQGGASKFIPFNDGSEGDWLKLKDSANKDMVSAHNWYPSLSGISDGAVFDKDKIINEYYMALETYIVPKQDQWLRLFKSIFSMFGMDASSLSIINKPPSNHKPDYMFIWEARKADGMPFDANDPLQQGFLADIKNTSRQVMTSKEKTTEETPKPESKPE